VSPEEHGTRKKGKKQHHERGGISGLGEENKLRWTNGGASNGGEGKVPEGGAGKGTPSIQMQMSCVWNKHEPVGESAEKKKRRAQSGGKVGGKREKKRLKA